MSINDHITLTNVLCVPSFAYNLFSISKLLQDTTYQVTFMSGSCYLQNPSWMKDLELGRLENGLYMLTAPLPFVALTKTTVHLMQLAGSQASSSQTSRSLFNAQVSSVDIWHARLGHVLARIVHMLPIDCQNRVLDHKRVLDIYDICHFTKQSRLSFPIVITVLICLILFMMICGDLMGSKLILIVIGFLLLLKTNPEPVGFICCQIRHLLLIFLKSLFFLFEISSMS